MSIKTSVFVATSVDGYLSRKDGNIDWLNHANLGIPNGEDCGYSAFWETVDVLVMGRHTFEQVLTFGSWPYANKPVIVLSSNPIDIPVALPQTVSSSSESPEALITRLSTVGEVKHLYVDGGVTIQRFLVANLIDEITITLIPVVLGEGRPLFGAIGYDLKLTHLSTKVFGFGFVQTKYAVIKNKAL